MRFDRNLALIGIGHWGKNLARNFNSLGALHSVCDVHSSHLAQYQSLYPHVYFTKCLNQILDNPEIKKIAIAVPTAFHYEIAKKALEKGKDVFVEKAVTRNAEEANELAWHAKDKGLVMMVGHILHYHPCIQRIKELIQVGDLGDLLHLNFSRLNFGSRGPEESALWAFAPHDISVLLSFCKNYTLESVRCNHGQFYSKNHLDQSWISLKFLKNVRADIHVSWMNPVPERRMTIVGTKGSVVFDDLKDWGEKLTFWENAIEVSNNYLNFNQKSEEKVMLEPREPLHEECKHFLNCCEERTLPITNGFEGYEVMRVLDLATKSAEENKVLNFSETELETVNL